MDNFTKNDEVIVICEPKELSIWGAPPFLTGLKGVVNRKDDLSYMPFFTKGDNSFMVIFNMGAENYIYTLSSKHLHKII